TSRTSCFPRPLGPFTSRRSRRYPSPRPRFVRNWRGAPPAGTPSGPCFPPLFCAILTSTAFTRIEPTRRMRLNKLQQIAVNALEDIKARDIKVLDVRKLTRFYHTLIIVSAESNRQVKALAHHVRDKLKEAGATIIGIEGEESGEWVLVDCGDIVVHV